MVSYEWLLILIVLNHSVYWLFSEWMSMNRIPEWQPQKRVTVQIKMSDVVQKDIATTVSYIRQK